MKEFTIKANIDKSPIGASIPNFGFFFDIPTRMVTVLFEDGIESVEHLDEWVDDWFDANGEGLAYKPWNGEMIDYLKVLVRCALNEAVTLGYLHRSGDSWCFTFPFWDKKEDCSGCVKEKCDCSAEGTSEEKL
jgi:hypothetical protein